MSNAAAAAATATDAATPPKGKNKKMLVIIIVAAVLVLALAGVGAMLMMKKPAESDDDEAAAETKPAKTAVKQDPKAVPTFVPLDPFVVNLADREAERYAQIGMTLEISDAKVGDKIKVYMPALRHAVLMVLADRTADQLIEREGKLKLARDVQREVSRVLGAEIDDGALTEEADPPAGGKKDPKKGKKKKKEAPAELPVRAVHFSSFIVQ